VPAKDGSLRQAYQLTEKGHALKPLLKAMRDWGLQWETNTQVGMMKSIKVK
jgi:DNA-binding HxlR family transcriptional regulator